jgi:hypothetical protein
MSRPPQRGELAAAQRHRIWRQITETGVIYTFFWELKCLESSKLAENLTFPPFVVLNSELVKTVWILHLSLLAIFSLIEIGPLQQIKASKEVVLSAGAIGSPHILLNSGIGNAEALTAIGIKPLVDLPDVGENLVDHPFGGVRYNISGTDTFDDVNRIPAVREQAIEQWINNGTGLLTNTIVGHIMFLRTENQTILSNDPAAGPKTPHIEILIAVRLCPLEISDAGIDSFSITTERLASWSDST